MQSAGTTGKAIEPPSLSNAAKKDLDRIEHRPLSKRLFQTPNDSTAKPET